MVHDVASEARVGVADLSYLVGAHHIQTHVGHSQLEK